MPPGFPSATVGCNLWDVVAIAFFGQLRLLSGGQIYTMHRINKYLYADNILMPYRERPQQLWTEQGQ
jgi:hypothetical protein